jgi:hypothetical protein
LGAEKNDRVNAQIKEVIYGKTPNQLQDRTKKRNSGNCGESFPELFPSSITLERPEHFFSSAARFA